MFEIFDYDRVKYDFGQVIRQRFNAYDLARLHELIGYERFERKNDQSTVWHKKYYSMFDDPAPEFVRIYTEFVHKFIVPMHKEEIIYQTRPTFRTNFPNNVCVGEFHRDRDYNHSTHEINYLLPLTDMYDTNSVWIESEEGSEDFAAPTLKPGQILRFSGANLRHGNKTNATPITRVSFDFRVLPISHYEASEKTTINTPIKFVIGGYWSKLGNIVG